MWVRDQSCGEDKKLLLHEDMLLPLSCAVELARRRRIETSQAFVLSSDQVKEVAMGMKSYLKELDIGGGALGHVRHSQISAVSPQLFRSAFPNNSEDQLVKRQSHSRESSLPLLLLETWCQDHCS